MYFKKIEIENYGPLKKLDVSFPFTDEGNPKPLAIVGRNGSGKSIFLSHLINVLMSSKENLYPKTEVEAGRVYKLRNADYITAGKNYSFIKVHISKGIEFHEWILQVSKKDFANVCKFTPKRKEEWAKIPDGQNSVINNNFLEKQKELKELVDQNCALYFPPNRFEEPGWLNEDNLLFRPEHTDKKRIEGFSNRNIICHSPLKTNMNWLFDLILDREIYERKFQNIELQNNAERIQIFRGHEGPSHTVYEETIKLLRIILRDDKVRFGIGTRKTRRMSVMRDDEAVVPHILQLSTGETALLNLFLSILRDFDLSDSKLTSLAEISGTVIIDEIDAHLHAQFQFEVLPLLISMFAKVQFIITTHSPLFLLGLEKKFGEHGFEILELPDANPIDTERFSEFEDAYQTFVSTEKFQSDVETEILKSQKPIVFVEGDYDIRYLEKAATFLGKDELLSKIHLKNGNGFGNLNKIWKLNKISQLVNKKVLLLYDCDTKATDDTKENLYKRVIPAVSSNPLEKGIENLFSETTIDKAKNHNSAFIDTEEEHKKTEGGQEITIPKIISINKDKKGNICNWLCENGNKEDFSGFIKIFKIIEDALSLSEENQG